MRETVQKLVDDHIALAAQYEAVGDFNSAASLRAVANMVAALLEGKEAGTLLPKLTDSDRASIKAKEKEFTQREAEFLERHRGAYDDIGVDDPDYETAHFEAARRIIDLVIHKPAAAPPIAWLGGLEDGVEFMHTVAGEMKEAMTETHKHTYFDVFIYECRGPGVQFRWKAYEPTLLRADTLAGLRELIKANIKQ